MPRAQDGVPLRAAPAVGRARRSPPPAFLWMRVETRKHCLPSPTASLPSFRPAAALPACCNSLSRLPRWELSLNPIPGETGASDPRCFRRKSSSLPRASQTFEMLDLFLFSGEFLS